MEFNKNNIPLHTDNKKEHNNVSFERNKKDKEQEKLLFLVPFVFKK